MGISGLLPLLSECTTKDAHVKKYRGQKVGIDASTWLHKGAYGCATQLARGIPTDSFLRYFMHYVDMLVFYGVTPVVVFDGAPLPMKKLTNDRRRAERDVARKTGNELYNAGRTVEAGPYFQKCISITHAMRTSVITALREKDIRFVVAPYEADAQLAFLYNTKQVHAVITEDSDLASYGCELIFTKMDRGEMASRSIFLNSHRRRALACSSAPHCGTKTCSSTCASYLVVIMWIPYLVLA